MQTRCIMNFMPLELSTLISNIKNSLPFLVEAVFSGKNFVFVFLQKTNPYNLEIIRICLNFIYNTKKWDGVRILMPSISPKCQKYILKCQKYILTCQKFSQKHPIFCQILNFWHFINLFQTPCL